MCMDRRGGRRETSRCTTAAWEDLVWVGCIVLTPVQFADRARGRRATDEGQHSKGTKCAAPIFSSYNRRLNAGDSDSHFGPVGGKWYRPLVSVPDPQWCS
jgi:hypothetical protein